MKANYVYFFLIALAVNLAAGFVGGLSKPMASDAEHYLDIGKSLAAGNGYFLPHGFWPDVPTMSRSPVWPFAVSLAVRIFPGVSPDILMRCLNLMLNSLVAVLVAILVRRVVGDLICGNSSNNKKTLTNLCAALGGAFYIFYPTALFLACQGASEITFLLLSLSGVIVLMGASGTRSATIIHAALGGLLLGLSALARPNFILWIGFFGVLVIGATVKGILPLPSGERVGVRVLQSKSFRTHIISLFILGLLFLLPSFLWAVRNYHICGHFPVLSTLRGQTLYGGNNDVVSKNFEYWGYWVFPDVIPGEPRMEDLAHSMSEYEVDCYYTAKGWGYIRAHAADMPQLLLGKLVRAYVPVPWKPTAATSFVSALRWILYGLALAGIILAWGQLGARFKIIMGAVILTNVATVVVFWGCARFAFVVEPFLIPFAVYALFRMFIRRTGYV